MASHINESDSCNGIDFTVRPPLTLSFGARTSESSSISSAFMHCKKNAAENVPRRSFASSPLRDSSTPILDSLAIKSEVLTALRTSTDFRRLRASSCQSTTTHPSSAPYVAGFTSTLSCFIVSSRFVSLPTST